MTESDHNLEEESLGVITKIEEVKSGKGMKYRIFVEDVLFCSLKRRELKAAHLTEGDLLTVRKKQELLTGPLYQRGKAYALHLLDSRPMTCEQVRRKLSEHSYPPESVEKILSDLCEAGILNDLEYATSYLLTYSGKESAGRIRMKLKTKGVPSDIMEEAFAASEDLLGESPEREALQKAFDRYSKNVDFSDRASRDSLIRKLLYRGFRFGDILEMISERDPDSLS